MIAEFLSLFVILVVLSKLHSTMERLFHVKPCNRVSQTIDTASLRFFKQFRLFLFIAGSFEHVVNGPACWSVAAIGLVLFLFGLILRILAILSLGSFWSFNVVLYENHQLIRTGIYRFIRHPSYLGNVYLTGLFIFLNANITALMCLLFVIGFYIHRTKIENRVLLFLEAQHE